MKKINKYQNVDFVIMLDEIDSTQTLAKEIIKRKKILEFGRTLIIAKKQTAGRGQNNNRWSSNDGGLYFSYVFSISEKNFKKVIELSLRFAEVIKKILEEYKIDCVIKYPNDVYAKIGDEYKKVSGILIETIPLLDKRYVIVGVGVNFTNKIDDEFRDKAVTIYEITGKRYSKKKFLEKFFKLSDEIINDLVVI